MAERIAYLEAVVGADITQFRKGMRDIRNETGILSETLQGIAGIGRSLTFSLTAPLVTMGTYFAQTASTFDANMRNINSIVHLTQGEFEGLSKATLDYGMNTRAGANAASEALYAIFSAGYGLNDTSKAMDLLKYTTLLSEAGLSDLTKTTETMTQTLMTYSSSGLTAAHATDVWAQMVAFGVGDLASFQQNAGKVLPASNALGVSFDNLGATAAYLSVGFGSGSKAMTAMGMLESNLMKPNATLAASYAKLGVATGQDLVAKFGSLEEAVIAVRNVTDDLDFANGFSKTGMEAALMLTNNIDKTRDAYKQFYSTVNGAAMGQWEQQIQSFAYQFDRFKSALQGVAIALGSQILPLVAPLLNMLSDGLTAFAQLNPEVHRFVVVMGMIAAAIGPVMWIFGSLIGTLTPLGLLFKGIIAAGAAFSSNFMGIRDSVEKATAGITGSLGPLAKTINDFYQTLMPDSLKQQTDHFADAFGADFTNRFTGNFVTTVDTSKAITVKGPTSLWGLFKSQGYDKIFSWKDFMKKAEAGGWKKGALNAGDIINIDGLDTAVEYVQKTKSQMALMMDGGLETPTGKQKTPTTFLDRMKEAITNALPGVLTEMGRVLTSIKDWADSNIGKGLDFLASIFGGSNDTNGRTPIYTALQKALNGDVYGAINDVIPGAGDHLRDFLGTDFGAKLSNALPAITDGITSLLHNAGDWLRKEGVPTLSRAIGYVVGRAGVAFGKMLGGIWDNIANGGAAKDAGNAANVLGDAVIDPAMQGFNDAMKDTGVVNIGDKFFSGLSGILITAAGTWVIGTAFTQGVMAAIKLALGWGSDFLLWAGGWALTGLGYLASSLAAKSGLDVVWSAALGTVKSGIGTAFGTAFSAISSATTWIVSSALSVVGSLATAIATSPITFGIMLGSLLYIAIPDSVKDQMRRGFTSIVDSIFGDGTTYHLNDQINDAVILGVATGLAAVGKSDEAKKVLQDGLSGNTGLSAPMDISIDPTFSIVGGMDLSTQDGKDAFMSQYFPKTLDLGEIAIEGKPAFDEIKGQIDSQIATMLSPDAIANATKNISLEQYQKNVNDLRDSAYSILATTLAEKPAEWSITALNSLDIPVSDVTLNTDGATVTMPNTEALVPDDSTKLATYITPDGKVITENLVTANTNLDTGLTTLGNTFGSYIASGGSLDPQKMKDQFITPLETMFLGVFGATGTVTLAMSTFGTNLATDFVTIGSVIATANTDIAAKLAPISLSFTNEFDKICKAIQTGMDKLTGWNLAVSNMKPAPTGGNGYTPVDGSHANGLTSVPKDGYIAELHKGERVLTATEAASYDSMPNSTVVPQNSGGSAGVTNAPVYNFYEAPSIDRIVRELNRQGYKIDKR